jgi:predicted RNA-binding protein YlqC (UPF0109 family)
MMKALVEHIAVALVDKPDQVNVVENENGDMINLELTVAQEDLGKVIGKQGRTARAMRSILSAAAARDNKKSRLDILE